MPVKRLHFVVFLKIIISIGAVFFVVKHLHHFKFEHFESFSTGILFLVILLTFLNWFTEILKWKHLASSVKHITLIEAAKQSLISFSISLLTPNRVGELGAKPLFYNKILSKKIFSLSLIGSTSQMFTSLLFGLLGLVELQMYYHDKIRSIYYFSSVSGRNVIGLIAVFVLLVLLLVFIKNKYQKLLITSSRIWLDAGLFSILKYLIFSFQFLIIYKHFSPDADNLLVYIAIVLTYFIATLIPMLAFLDWAVKGSVAIFVFKALSLNENWAMYSVGLMWFLNFAVPFIVGVVLMWWYKFKPNTVVNSE